MTKQDSSRLWTGPFILICIAHFVLTLGFHACMPVLPLFLEDCFVLSGIALGAVLASYTASAILTRPPTGYWLDRYGRKIVYLPGYFLFGLAYFLYPLADSAFEVGVVRFLHGALWGVTMGAANTAAVDLLPPERRGEGIGYFGLTMVLGMSVGPAIGTYVAAWKGYDFMFNGIAVLTLTGFLFLCFIRLPDIPKRVQPLTVDSLLEKSSLPISLATLIFCIPFSAFTNFSALYARAIPGASPGIFFLCMAIGAGLTRIFSGKRFDRLGPSSVIYFGYAFGICGCLIVAFAQGPVSFSLGGLVVGLGNGVTIPVLQTMINSLVPPQRRGAANATQMTAFDIGVCLGLLGISHLQSLLGWTPTYLLLIICLVGSALVFHSIALPRYKAKNRY